MHLLGQKRISDNIMNKVSISWAIQKFVWMTFFLLLIKLGISQNTSYNYELISTELHLIQKGLSQNSIRCIYQDSKGYIWVGTWAGLNRYDGQQIISLQADIDNTEGGLTNSVINAIEEDTHQNIWVGTEGGINKINAETFEVSYYDKIGNYLKHGSSDTILSLKCDESKLWIGSQHGLVFLDLNHDSLFIPQWLKTGVIQNTEVRSINLDHEEYAFLATNIGLCIIDFNNSQYHFLNPSKTFPNASSIMSLETYDANNILVGTENGLYVFNIPNQSFQRIRISKGNPKAGIEIITAIEKDNDSLFWIASSGMGIKQLQWRHGKPKVVNVNAENINNDDRRSDFTTEKYYYSILKAKNGIVWIGSAWSGMFKFIDAKKNFKKFQSSGSAYGLIDNQIWAFFDDTLELWIGTNNGISIYNKHNHSMRQLTNKGPVGKRLSSSNIRSIFKDSEGNFWIGTYKMGLNKYNPQSGEIQVYTPLDTEHYVADNTVWHIIEDSYHNLLICTHNGFQIKNLITGTDRVFRNDPKNPKSISSNVVYNIYVDRQENIWLSTFRGWNKFDLRSGSFKPFLHQNGNANSLNVNKIFCTYQDDSLNYWIGTIGGGLNYYNPRTKKFRTYTKRDGLPDNTIYAILDDGMGNLWLSSNYGVSSFNIENKTFRNYTVMDGLQSNEFNFGASLKDSNGNIYFGGMFGFNVFNPRELVSKNLTNSVVVSEVNIKNHLPLYFMKNGDHLELKHNQNNIKLRFSLLDYVNASKDVYKYRIEGLGNEWKTTDLEGPYVELNNLDAGVYVLHVMGLHSTGNWTQQEAVFTFKVGQVWYKLLWIRIVLIIILLIMTAVYIRNRMRRIQFKHDSEKQLLELEKQTLKLQMNPHFIFNTLNSIQNYILKNDTENSIHYLSKFSRLMRMMMTYSREKTISLEEEVLMIESYLEIEKLRHEKGFSYRVFVDDDLDQEFIGIPPMMVQPFIENALIHGLLPMKKRNAYLEIRFFNHGDYIKVEVEDNGIGRAESQKSRDQKHRPSGILITQKRLELINKEKAGGSYFKVIDLKDENGEPIGTRVEIEIQKQEIIE